MSRGPNLPPAIAEAVTVAAEQAHLSPYALLQKTNTRNIVAARKQVFVRLHGQGFSLKWIAKWFHMSHTTVLHHLKGAAEGASSRAPVQLQHRRGPRHYIKAAEVEEFQCARCGFRSAKASEFRLEGYRRFCLDTTRCWRNELKYQEFCKMLIDRLS